MTRLKNFAQIIIDLTIVVISYMIAIWVRMDLSFVNFTFYGAVISNIPLILVCYFVIFKILRLDKSIFGMESINEAVRVSVACVLGSAIVFTLITVLKLSLIPRSIYFIQAILLVLLMEFERFSYRIYNLLTKKSKMVSSDATRTVIVGAGAAGMMLLREITTNKIYHNHVVGFVDDDHWKIGKFISGVPILGSVDDLTTVVNSNQVELLIVAMPRIQLKVQKEIIRKCYESGCKVQVITSSQDMISSQGIKRSLREIGIEDLLGRESIQLDNVLLNDFIEQKTVFVTGAAGSIGGELCRQIIQLNPKQLVMIDINENGLYDLQQEFNMLIESGLLSPDSKFIPLITSVRDVKALRVLFERYRPEIVFHAAAHKHVPLMEDMPIEAIKNNIFGTYNLIITAEEYGVERFVSISTDKAVNPTNVMGATKRFVEKMIQSRSFNDSKTKFVAVRFGNVLGSNGSIIPLFKKQIASGGPLTLTDKNIIRYFMTIPEAVSLVLQAATYGKGGEIFVLDMGQPVKILDLAEKMIRLSGLVPYQDIDIKEIGLRPGEKLYEELTLNKEDVSTTPNNLIFIAQPVKIDPKIIERELEILREVLEKTYVSDDDVIKALQEVVNTYVPNHFGGMKDV